MRTPAGYLFLGGTMKYEKPPLGIVDQIQLLSKRGMEIPNPQRAIRYLSHISYFRLRGYWIPFEKKDKRHDHRFIDGTTFDDVLNLYIFDRKFRLLMLEAIERVEISFRAHFANELGVAYGSHFYLDTKYAYNIDLHERLLTTLASEIHRSTELFIEHYNKNLTFIRNITAHHGRLWNRRMTITMRLPKKPKVLSAMLNPEATRYIGNTVIMLGYFLKLISPGTSWPHRMQQLVTLSPGIRPAAMGFQKDWQQLSLWNGI